MGGMTAKVIFSRKLARLLVINQTIMPLNQKDLELIERVIYKNGDDIAISIGRSFERLEERLEAIEARLNGRLADIEDAVKTR